MYYDYDKDEDGKKSSSQRKKDQKQGLLSDSSDKKKTRGSRSSRQQDPDTVNYPIRGSFQEGAKKGSRVAKGDSDDDSDSVLTDHSSKTEDSQDNLSESGSDYSTSSMSDASDSSMGGGTKKKLIKRKGCDKFWLHFKLLTSKNYWIFRRNLKLTLVQIIAPIFFCLLILFFQWTSSKWLNFEITRPPQ